MNLVGGKGTESMDLEKNDLGPRFIDRVYSAVVVIRHGHHNHKRDDVILRRHLPVNVVNEADTMIAKNRMNFQDVLRHLEDKYEIFIKESTLRKRIRWNALQQVPRDRECMALIDSLQYLKKNWIWSGIRLRFERVRLFPCVRLVEFPRVEGRLLDLRSCSMCVYGCKEHSKQI